MPYSGRLPAIAFGKPMLIVGFDPTHVLCVNDEGRLEYIEHKDIEIPLHGDAEAVYWMENGGYALSQTPIPVDAPDAGPDDDTGDSR